MAACDKSTGSYVVGSEFAADVLELGKYDGVADSFSNLYLAQIVSKMAFGSCTVSCGVKSQSLGFTGAEQLPSKAGGPMGSVRLRNLTIIGNCLDKTADPAGGVSHDAAGLLPVAAANSVSCDDLADVVGRL